MKAIILCAGYGTRLGDLTKDIPKPMLPIDGKPLLQHIIAYLKKNNIDQIGINLHYRPEVIKDYFNNGNAFGVELTYSYEEKLLGTAGALVEFEEIINNEDVVVIYGDVITDQKLKPIMDLHKKEKAFATILLHKNNKSNSFVRLNDKNRIIDFIERPARNEMQEYNVSNIYSNSAVQVLSGDALRYIKAKKVFDLPRDIYSKLYKEKRIYGYKLESNRIAIDSNNRYKKTIDMIIRGEMKW